MFFLLITQLISCLTNRDTHKLFASDLDPPSSSTRLICSCAADPAAPPHLPQLPPNGAMYGTWPAGQRAQPPLQGLPDTGTAPEGEAPPANPCTPDGPSPPPPLDMSRLDCWILLLSWCEPLCSLLRRAGLLPLASATHNAAAHSAPARLLATLAPGQVVVLCRAGRAEPPGPGHAAVAAAGGLLRGPIRISPGGCSGSGDGAACRECSCDRHGGRRRQRHSWRSSTGPGAAAAAQAK